MTEAIRVEVCEGAVLELNLERLEGSALANAFGNWAEIDVTPAAQWPMREEVSLAASSATGRYLVLDGFDITSPEEGPEEELILHFREVLEAAPTVDAPRPTTEAEDSLARIKEASEAVEKARAEVSDAKEELRSRKSLLTAAVAHLQEVIRAETTPLPLFDHARRQSPEPEEAAQEDAPGIPADQWRYTGINLALPDLPESLLRKLHEHGLHTVGDVADFTAAHPLTDIPGIGQTKAEMIEAAFDRYWARQDPDGLAG